MGTHQNKELQEAEKLKEIPKWTRKYAQNRMLPALIQLIISACLFAGIAIPSYFGGKAYRSGDQVLFWTSNAILAVAMIFLVFFSVPKWGGKFVERLSKQIYGVEGDVSISLSKTAGKNKRLGYLVAIVFGSCIFISVILGLLGYLPIKYMQPISALYFVPFVAFLYFWQKPIISPLALLWPSLYAIHAILIVAGVPILFTGNLIPLNMILPVFGYGFLTYIIGHLYSRYALKKLKDLTHLEGGTANGD